MSQNILVILFSLYLFLQSCQSKDCACGRMNGKGPSTRIVNGKEVSPPHKYPWMVSISDMCGGSLITNRHVLTAAHCVNPPAAYLWVDLGLHDKRSPNPKSKRVKVLSKHVHNDWKGEAYAYGGGDIAILTLATPVNFNTIISPVCLPPGDKRTYLGGKATISGWGRTANGNPAQKLQEVVLDTLQQCPTRVLSGYENLLLNKPKMAYSRDAFPRDL